MLPARRNQNWMSDIFNDIFNENWMRRTNATVPAINVTENDHGYELALAAPGMTKENFNLTLDADGDLVIKMEKKVENKEENGEKGRILRHEWNYTEFQQTMILPENADRDKIAAKVENGVLTVDIPKMEKVQEEEKGRLIEIL